ncbi:MAG TPA: hypothetical protein VIG44_06515 [Thermomicrobiales bacterium]
MATRKMPEKTPADVTASTIGDDSNVDFSFSSSAEGKPKTAQELYHALVENGFIGAWKDRTDIGDSAEYARLLRKRASERLRGQ